MSQVYEYAEVTFAGVGWSDATFTVDRYAAEREASLARGSMSSTVTITLEDGGVALQRAMFRLTPNQRGVSIVTLWRRAWYGGRKGRAAWRRLLTLEAAGVEVGFYATVAAAARAQS